MTDATMRALVHHDLTPAAVELREIPVPTITDDQVLVRVEAVGVCGSDIHQYHNTQSWPVAPPVVLGHEFCGRIASRGSDECGLRDGELVVSETAAVVNPDSPFTRAGKYNLDPARRGFGSDIDGAMAEYVAVPVRLLHRVPDGVPVEIAAMTEPCCVAYQAVVVRSHIRPGDVVVIIGPGPIGLLCASLARLCGAGAVVLVGTSQDTPRLKVGLCAGATHAVDGDAGQAAALVSNLGDGAGADLVIDAAGASASLRQALDLVRPAGQITKVGWGPQPLGISLDPLVRKAVTLHGSFSHTWEVWERVLRLLSTGQLDPRPYIGKISDLADWQTCFDAVHSRHIIKAILTP